MIQLFIFILSVCCICFAVFSYNVYFIITLLSFKNIFVVARRQRYEVYGITANSTHMPPVSVLLPAYNEEITIIESVKSLMQLNYSTYEIIVVNDGSKDQTLNTLIKEFKLYHLENFAIQYNVNCTKIDAVYYNPEYPFLYVVDKVNGGKGDALNAGINFSNYPLICALDADSVLEKDALFQIAAMYMENPEQYVAIGGMLRIANGCKIENGVLQKVQLPKKWLPMFQTFEYLRAFLLRIGWSSINGLNIISGAFGLFRKEYVVMVGGYPRNARYLSEDIDMTFHLHRYMLENKLPYKIGSCPEAVCWTQAPNKYHALSDQRQRWERAIWSCMIENYDMIIRPKYKIFGLFTLPFNIIEMLSAYFEFVGLLLLIGLIILYDQNIWYSMTILISAILGWLILNVSYLLLEEIAFKRYVRIRDLLRMLAFNILLMFSYRWLVMLWQIQGHVKFFQKNDTWGEIPRQSWK